MAEVKSTSPPVRPDDSGAVPQSPRQRKRIRDCADRVAAGMDRSRPPGREVLEVNARRILDELDMPHEFLGFTMVAVSNSFWRDQFAAVAFSRRLLFLPTCLRDRKACKGRLDSAGLDCASCGACAIDALKKTAEGLGCRVIIAEGTPAVVSRLLDCDADAIVGVACLDSLEKAFARVADVGVPCMAVPLLRNGCADTAVETDQVLSFLNAQCPRPERRPRTYAPLLRESVRLFAPEALSGILAPVLPAPKAASATDAIALDWIQAGGKRFRPFITLAAYVAGRHGASALSTDADTAGLIPPSMKAVAVAIELLHKASLVHDDIEDDDAFRYGRRTLHTTHGTGPAINVGDYLIGLGYRLISEQAGDLGSDCVTDVLAHLSSAHIELCRGQGDELLGWKTTSSELRPIDALSMYALKTAPAFETALYAGLRPSGTCVDDALLRKFSTYVGEAYQVLNDLKDWSESKENKVVSGLDALTERPTILRALAIESGARDALAEAAGRASAIRAVYENHGVFEQARTLANKLRQRALGLTEELKDAAFADLLRFITRTVLQPK